MYDVKIKKGLFTANLLLDMMGCYSFGYYSLVLEGVVPASTFIIS